MNVSQKTTATPWRLVAVVLFTFSLTVVIRFILYYDIHESFWHVMSDGTITPLLSPDPGLYGYQAKQLLQGLKCDECDLNAYVIYWFVKYLNINIDTFMLYAPAFFASFLVIPIILVWREIGYTYPGVLIALFCGCTFGYYSRTYLGYFDTDTLNLFFLVGVVCFMVMTVTRKNFLYSLAALVSAMLLLAWYHNAMTLLFGLLAGFALVILVAFTRNKQAYMAWFVIAVALVPLPWYFQLMIAFALAGIFKIVLEKIPWWIFPVLMFLGAIAFLMLLDISIIQTNLLRYFLTPEYLPGKYGQFEYEFIYPMKYVAEARFNQLTDIASHMIGGTYFLLLGLFGYGLLAYQKRVMLFFLPLLVLGMASIQMGIRFNIYGGLVVIMGLVYLLWKITGFSLKGFSLKRQLPVFMILLLPFVYAAKESIAYWNKAVAFPVFTATQLNAMKQVLIDTKEGDFAVTWWDYGWPLWYYTGLKTLIDNGKHHKDNYTVAKIFTEDSQKNAHHYIQYFYERYRQMGYPKHIPVIHASLRKTKDLGKLLTRIENGKLYIKPEVDKYIIMPFQMVELYNTIQLFTRIEKNPDSKKMDMFISTQPRGEDQRFIHMENGVSVNKDTGIIYQGKVAYKIKAMYKIKYTGKRKTVETHKGHPEGVHVVFHDKRIYIMDDNVFNSFLIQAWFFENINSQYFETKYSDKFIKIIKVK